MKRVLSFAATGLFVTGLALSPLAARADDATTGAKGVTPSPAGSVATPTKPTVATGVSPSAPTVKMDDKKAVVTPSGATVKAPAKGS